MPLNLTNTIRFVNIPPNLINLIYDSKLYNKISVIYICGLHGKYYNPATRKLKLKNSRMNEGSLTDFVPVLPINVQQFIAS